MSTYNFLEFTLDTEQHTLFKSGVRLEIGSIAYDLLVYFVKNPNKTIERNTLLKNVWVNKVVSDATLYKQIQRLRKILGDTHEQKNIISTVHGVGFIFTPKLCPQISIEKKSAYLKPQKLLYSSLSISLIAFFLSIFLIYQFLNNKQSAQKSLSLHQSITELHLAMSINKKAFISQINQRNELGKLLSNRFEIDQNLSWERLFFKYHNVMNAEERFIFAQIRAYTDGPMLENNQRLLNLINNNKGILKAIPLAIELRNHLSIWLNKYNRIFMLSEKMCLLYVGVEDGAPYPSEVDNQVSEWLKQHQN